ncbi:hypothetical protein FQ087_18670 [Sporosarcina sp. ANT_H38]|uniref:phage tail protein n=1 Tax=Sporosarcina sp. ANT_H38 TaxID=2597358 RepID=UPI0011F0E0B8|nr:tail fiber protein [Sporosarcina sp. ANT_H38]KAA0944149.1 hypothetical protein FQ087_18670 [Sporosarcina sp. ANT_H38]
MARYRTINVDLNRQYRNDLNANFSQIEADLLALQNISNGQKQELLAELSRIERESKDRDNVLAKQNLETLLQSIETAKNNANTAAANADVKAGRAQTQGDYAKTQGDYAKVQGAFANLKGDFANEKATLADKAAGNANLEASNLSALKVAVVDATQNANTAIENLGAVGAYSMTTTYYPKNTVEYNGSGYMNILLSKGILPTNTTYWKKVVSKGDKGDTGNTGSQGLQGIQGIKGDTGLQGIKGDKGDKGDPGTVTKVNNIGPDASGNVTLPLPTEPDLTVYAKKTEVSSSVQRASWDTKETPTGSQAKVNAHENKKTNPHAVTKTQVGLSEVDNIKQATKAEFDTHKAVVASPTTLGHVKVGTNLTVTADGTLNASGGSVPDASTTVKGIVKLNDALNSSLTTEAATANAVKQVNDLKANKSQESQISISLQNGWGGNLRCYKNQFGVVQLFGMVTVGSLPSGTIATLPIGYRPVNAHFFSSPTASSATDGRTMELLLRPDGTITPNATPLKNIYIENSFRL